MVLERLDRALATNSLISLNPTTHMQHFHTNSSNHNPIIIKPKGIIACRNGSKKCGWKTKVVEKLLWQHGESSSQVIYVPIVSKIIRQCGEKLFEWIWLYFGSIWRQLEEKTKLLVKGEQAIDLRADWTSIKTHQMELNELMDKENIMWQQCSQTLFLRIGIATLASFIAEHLIGIGKIELLVWRTIMMFGVLLMSRFLRLLVFIRTSLLLHI